MLLGIHVRARLFLIALGRGQLDAETAALALRLLDAWRVRERC